MDDQVWRAFQQVVVAPVEDSALITSEMLAALRQAYQLDWDGPHGYRHWVRVRENGLRLAGATGANAKVAELFAFLHDVGRQNDGWDTKHGLRAVAYIEGEGQRFFDLSPAELELLKFACAHHTDGKRDADVSVQVCWDADRLDLGRVHIRPEARYLCTPVAQNPRVIEWAFQRSQESLINGGYE
jgi:uncharacterized protein